MARIDPKNNKIQAKIVYYGPGLCGKTTNLEYVSTMVRGGGQEMMSLATEGDRTIFFDFLPLELGSIRGMATSFKLYTVPGQVRYNETRKMVLKNVDGVVFVADSQPDMMEANIESLENLFENLAELGIKRDAVSLLLQYNKRDLPRVLSQRELDQGLNRNNYPVTLASAVTGQGVMEALKAISKLVIRQLAIELGETPPPVTRAVAESAVVTKPVVPPGPATRSPVVAVFPPSGRPAGIPESAPRAPVRTAVPPPSLAYPFERTPQPAGAAPRQELSPAPLPQAVAASGSREKAGGHPDLSSQVLAAVEQHKQMSHDIAQKQAAEKAVEAVAFHAVSDRTERILRELKNLFGPLKAMGTQVGECKSVLEKIEKANGDGTAATDGVARLVAPLMEKVEAMSKRSNEHFAALEKLATTLQSNLRTLESKVGGPVGIPTVDIERMKRELLVALPTKVDVEGLIAKAQPKPADGGVETGKRIDAMEAKLLAMLGEQQVVTQKRIDTLDKGVSVTLERFDQRMNALMETISKALSAAPAAAQAPSGQAKPGEVVKPAAQAKPDESLKPAVQAKPDESLKPAAQAKPDESLKPAVQAKPHESLKPAAQAKPDESLKPAAQAKPDESLKPAAQAKPDESLKPAAQAKPDESLKPAAQANVDEGPKAQASAPAAPETPGTQESEAATAPKPAAVDVAAQKPTVTVGNTKPEDKAESGKDAFSDDPRHKAAARIARVMVADLYLYYKKEVEEGILQGDFDERNKEALADIRTTYATRVTEDVRAERDHLSLAIEEFVAKKRKEIAQRPEGGATNSEDQPQA